MIAKYLSIRPSLHLAWLRYSSVTDSRFAPSSRLARRAHRRPRCTRDFTITALAYRIAGDDPPVRAGRATRTGQTGSEEGETRALNLNQLEQLPSRATEQDPEWQTINVRLPTTQDQQVTVTVDGGYRGQPQLRSTLVFDKATAEVQTLTTFSDQSAGQRLRSWLRFVHTGEFYGVGGQTVAGVASLSAVMLVFTGLSLSIRRFLAWIGRR